MRGLGFLVLMVVLASGIDPARADLIFDFSFSNTTGNVAGTVTGEILGLADNTAGEAASDIEITSYPDALTGLPAAPFSIMAYAASVSQPVTSNVFTVTDGEVTAASFQVAEGYFDLNIIGIYSELFNSYPANYVQNQGGFDAITFSESPAPEPASIAILGSALAGLLGMRRFPRSRLRSLIQCRQRHTMSPHPVGQVSSGASAELISWGRLAIASK